MNKRALVLIAAAAVLVAAACGGDDDKPTAPAPVSKIVNFTATLTPAGELGSTLQGNTANSTGTFTATLDTSTNVFKYNVTFTGLTSNVTLGHIHGPFTPGGAANTANPILNFDPTVAGPGASPNPIATTGAFGKGTTAGTASGTVTLNATTQISQTINGDSLRKLIIAGLTYANIHTQTNGGGEVRGQIVRAP